MNEITRLVIDLCDKISNFGLDKYLRLPEKDKEDLNKLFSALHEFLD